MSSSSPSIVNWKTKTLTSNSSNNNNNNNNDDEVLDEVVEEVVEEVQLDIIPSATQELKKSNENNDNNNNNNGRGSGREHERTYITLISGSIAGICGTYVKQPIQRVKWLRQVSEHQTTMEARTIFGVFKAIVQKEGFFFGLWRGSVSAVTRNIPHATLVYTLFPVYMRTIESNSDYMKHHLPLLRSMSGSLASLSTTLLTHPLDTVNVRIVTQYQFFHYNSIFQTLRDIVREESVRALYQGLPMTMIGTVIRGGIGFGVYESSKSQNLREWRDRSFLWNFSQRLILGFGAGTITTTICYPIDTIRRRQQVFGIRRPLSSAEIKELGGDFRNHAYAKDAIKWIYQTEGFRGFYKGLLLGLIKTPIAIAVSFSVNDTIKKMFGWKG